VPSFAAQNFFFVMLLAAVLVSVGQMLADDVPKLWMHYRRVLVLMILGVSIGLTGGMVVETLGYKFLDSNGIWYRVEVTAEEFMEMMGASFILLAALQLRRRIRSRLTVTTTRVQPKQVQVLTKYQAVS